MIDESPIESYLDQLVRELNHESPRALRDLLRETEAHLRDAAEAAIAQGLDERGAEELAVRRFGPARAVAAAERDRLRPPLRRLAAQTLASAVLLGGIAAVLIGVSGAVAALIRAIGGERILVDDPGSALTPARCAGWLRSVPGAGSCRSAAIADWADEVVYDRLVAGLLGVFALGAYILWRRRTVVRGRGEVLLPAAVRDTIAATLFTAAGLWTAGLAIDAVVVSSGTGSGQWLSAAPLCLTAAAIFGYRLVRDLREPAPG
jgi:hypothetical protein